VHAWNKKIPITGITVIGTHPSPHMDEIGGIYLLQKTKEGRKLFPGIEKALPAVISETNLRNAKFTGFFGFITALSQGYLLIGLGKGPLDEHGDRKNKVSCIELIKRHLDLFASAENRSLYGPIIHYINTEDNCGDNLIKNMNKVNPGRKLTKEETEMLSAMNNGMFASVLKKGFETVENGDDKQFLNVFNTAMNFIGFQVEQRRMFLKACAEYDANKETIQKNSLDLPGDGILMIIKSDNTLAAKAAQSKNPSSAVRKLGILLLYKATKMEDAGQQFVIMPQNGFEGYMPDVLKILQQKISFKRTSKGLRFDSIGKFGTLNEVPELYFDENLKIIMNGSKSDPDAPGLIGDMLSVQDVIDAIMTVVMKKFDRRHEAKCSQGICPKVAEGKPCSLFSACLTHCEAAKKASKPVVKKAN
jgi:hypothetical protein